MDFILTIDPSGTGSTGVCLVNQESGEVSFQEFKSKLWEEHLGFLFDLVKSKEPKIVVFETTNYIRHRMQSSLHLFKLIGAIVAFKYMFSFIEALDSVAVNQVKSYKLKLQNKEEEMAGLSLERGRGKGWEYQTKKISLHQLDALIIFYLWNLKKTNEKKPPLPRARKKSSISKETPS